MQNQSNKEEEDYREWLERVVHIQHKVILPDHTTIDKTRWTSHNGFNARGFNLHLREVYNARYKKHDRE